jgi:hypothetical protein
MVCPTGLAVRALSSWIWVAEWAGFALGELPALEFRREPSPCLLLLLQCFQHWSRLGSGAPKDQIHKQKWIWLSLVLRQNRTFSRVGKDHREQSQSLLGYSAEPSNAINEESHE